MEEGARVELASRFPGTLSLARSDLTVRSSLRKTWWRLQESNLLRVALQASAFLNAKPPNGAQGRIRTAKLLSLSQAICQFLYPGMVRVGGFEPPSSWPSTSRIYQFSYTREWWPRQDSNLHVSRF